MIFVQEILRIQLHRLLCCHFSKHCNHSTRNNRDPDLEFRLQKRLERFHGPCFEDAEKLRKEYPDPASLIDDLYKPLIQSDKQRTPTFQCTPKFKGRLWKAVLHLSFPSTFTLVGIHKDLDKAKENAYLTACELYWNTGLLNRLTGEVSVLTPNQILSLLEKLCLQTVAPQSRKENNFDIRTSQVIIDGKNSWLTELQISWPISLFVKASGNTPYSSQFEAALFAGIKLKTLDLFDRQNNLRFDIARYLKGTYIASTFIPNVEDFNPDCVIHVDASRRGIGAYLEIMEEDGVRWFTERWPTDLTKKYFPDGHFDSSFGEIYAFVTACYTWKHKFVNKRVLCYSDCVSTVNLVNRGLYVSKERYSKFYKLNQILLTTIYKYKIEFLASYKPRWQNVPADLLSRQNVDQFREQVPNAYEKAKKIKKLAFYHPLIDKKSFEENHPVKKEKKRKIKKRNE